MSTPSPLASPETLRGILLMTATAAFFGGLDTTAKYLGQYIPAIEVAWLRFVTHTFFVVILLRLWSRPFHMKTRRPLLQLLRGAFMFGTTSLNFVALTYLDLTEAVSIMFATPLLVTALAGPFLGEKVGVRRWTAVSIGFLGVVVITRPGFGTFNVGVLFSLGAMLTNAFYILLTRKIGTTESSEGMIFYSGAVGSVGLAPVALPTAVMPELWLVPLIFLTGALGGFGHYLLIRAHRIAPASTLAPFIYTQILWMTVTGYLIFDEIPGLWTITGASIIVVSGLYILHREHLRKGGARGRV